MQKGVSALIIACSNKHCHTAIVQLLLDNNANINLQTMVCLLNSVCMTLPCTVSSLSLQTLQVLLLGFNSVEKQLWDMPVALDILMLWHY